MKVPPLGTRIHVDEVDLDLTITDFRETEVCAESEDGTEYRLDPRDFFTDKIRLSDQQKEPMTAPHVIRTEEEKVRLAKEVIAYLNEVVALDPEALHQLSEHRVPANKDLTQHETTQIHHLTTTNLDLTNPEDKGYVVGMVGILNGLVGVRPDGYGYITSVYGDDHKLQHFEPTKALSNEAWHPDVGDRPITDIDAEMLINGHRRRFVEGVQYYLYELMEDDNALHVIGHIESLCRDYEKLIRDAVKMYGHGQPPAPEPPPPDEVCSCEVPSVSISGMCSKCEKPGRP